MAEGRKSYIYNCVLAEFENCGVIETVGFQPEIAATSEISLPVRRTGVPWWFRCLFRIVFCCRRKRVLFIDYLVVVYSTRPSLKNGRCIMLM